MTHEWYKRHRPKLFKEMVGQQEAVSVLADKVKRKEVPHCLLLVGGSGTGKTTAARILKIKLGCGDRDFTELNAADTRGIDTIRDIRQTMQLSPLSGSCRIFLLDECHKLSSDAMVALLKLLEDPPAHVYFILATTDPGRLLKTILTRSTEIKFKPLSVHVLADLVKVVAEKEGVSFTDAEIARIAEAADGSARKALVIAEQVSGIEGEGARLEAIASADPQDKAKALVGMLMKPETKWKDIAETLKAVDGDVEEIRHRVLGYASAVLLGGGRMANRALQIIGEFEAGFYDGRKASLIRACYQVFGQKH